MKTPHDFFKELYKSNDLLYRLNNPIDCQFNNEKIYAIFIERHKVDEFTPVFIIGKTGEGTCQYPRETLLMTKIAVEEEDVFKKLYISKVNEVISEIKRGNFKVYEKYKVKKYTDNTSIVKYKKYVRKQDFENPMNTILTYTIYVEKGKRAEGCLLTSPHTFYAQFSKHKNWLIDRYIHKFKCVDDNLRELAYKSHTFSCDGNAGAVVTLKTYNGIDFTRPADEFTNFLIDYNK